MTDMNQNEPQEGQGQGQGAAPPPGPGPQPAAAAAAPATAQTKDDRTWGMLCHLAAFAGFFTGGIGNIVGPLVVWLIKKDESAYVDVNGKESLNFQITVMIALVVSVPLMFVGIGILTFFAALIIDVVFVIIAAIKTNEGTAYRYPMNIRFIK